MFYEPLNIWFVSSVKLLSLLPEMMILQYFQPLTGSTEIKVIKRRY
ncbi:hypothetical protein BN439_1413 [Erwinia amylovora Ea644]|nr:hypothetical protein BN439_1413 [Erwinia amylovora Ea644]CCP06499.1 hypothetical protein BN440_1457 [Erwinia amylovora MR1]